MTDWLRDLDSVDIMPNFTKFLTQCGINMDSITYVQLKPTTRIIFNIKELLQKGQIFTLNQFKDIISDIINTKDDFYKLLEPMKISFDKYIFSTPKSLFQLLLMITEISSFLVTLIIEKVCELVQTDNTNENDLAIKCLNQLRWCVSVCNSGDMLDKLLDLGYVSSTIVKRHIITMLPTVCYGRYKGVLATKLYDWMSSDNTLIDCCLDSINQLDLDSHFRHDTELLIISLLDTAAMHTLPAMITFLMKCADKSNIATFVEKVRSNVSFDNLQTMFSSAISSTPIDDRSPNCAINLINSIKINFQFNPNLQKIWLKSVSTETEIVRCQSFDLIVLLVVNDYVDKSCSVVSIFRAKIIKSLFTGKTVEDIFKYHLSMVRPLYNVLLEIVNATLNCGDNICCEFVKHVYEQCFGNDHDSFTASDIVNLLLTEITAKSPFSVDSKIAVLHFLAEKFPDKMRQFYTEICDLLSLGCRFTNSQIYDIYQILGILAFSADDNEPDNLKENITSVIRRQLHNPDLFVRRNGVIGAITVMRQLANCDLSEIWAVGTWARMISSQPESESDVVSINSEDQNSSVVSTVLKLLMSTADLEPQLSIVIFDELHRLISIDDMGSAQIDIKRIITNHFKDRYIVDIGIRVDSDCPAILGLVGTESCDVAVTLSQLKSQSVSVNMSVPAQFRLLALCEQKTQNNNLKEINALLGCSIILAKKVEEAQFTELIIIINWLIEVVNVFSIDVNDDNIALFNSTYALRLKHIVSQIASFEKRLAEQQTVVKLPPVQIMIGSKYLPVTEIRITTSKKRSIKSNKKKSKKSKSDNVDEHAADDLFGDDDFDTDAIVVQETKCKVLKDNLNLCYRELDLSVFQIMTHLVTDDLIWANGKKIGLEWVELEFYMNDLWIKTKHRLRTTNIIMEGVFSLKSNSAYRYIDRISLEDILKQLVKIGPLLKSLLSSCINICKNSEIFDDINGPWSKVLNLVLKIVSHIFYFLANKRNEKNDGLLAEFLFSLVSGSRKVLIDDIVVFLRQLITVKDHLPNVIIASSFLTLISHLFQYPMLNLRSFPISLRQVATECIAKKWSIDGEISLVDFKLSISTIFEIYLSTLSEEWFDVLQNDILPEMIDVANKERSVPSVEMKYGSLNRNTLFGFFKLIIDFINKKFKSLSKTSNSQRNTLEILQAWERPINVVRSLTGIVANHEGGNMLFCFIKFSRDLINMIIKNLMPILDNMLRHENLEVIQLLKYIQDVTRFIQRVCIHCKDKKNLPVTSLVPQVRRHLETFMYRVKKMMCINKCVGGSLNILPLANKDLHGNRIESADETDNEENKSDDNDEVVSACEESDNETVLDD